MVVQEARGTTKARNLLLRECRSDIILEPDDDSRVDPDYVENHLRHFADDRVDVVTGPVYEWDADSHEWYVKWSNHLMIGGWNGPAFASDHSYVGTNSSLRVQSALAIGGWDENILTHGEDEDFADRLHVADAVTVYDPKARLLHLRAPRGGERAAEWGSGPDGNWRVLAGYLYYYLANRPAYDAWAIMVGYALRPLWHIKHGRRSVGVRLLPRVLAAIPVSLWRWSRGRLLIDPASPDREVRRFSKKECGAVEREGWQPSDLEPSCPTGTHRSYRCSPVSNCAPPSSGTAPAVSESLSATSGTGGSQPQQVRLVIETRAPHFEPPRRSPAPPSGRGRGR